MSSESTSVPTPATVAVAPNHVDRRTGVARTTSARPASSSAWSRSTEVTAKPVETAAIMRKT